MRFKKRSYSNRINKHILYRCSAKYIGVISNGSVMFDVYVQPRGPLDTGNMGLAFVDEADRYLLAKHFKYDACT